ncbi:MAG: hypothetical protein RL367_1685 [Pseudomonadota bacterium]
MTITAQIRAWWLARKLVSKHAILMLAATLVTGPIALLVMSGLLQPVFGKIEQTEVASQKARVIHALAEFESGLKKATLDYAVWDDMYDYVANQNHGFELQTLTPVSHVNNGIDYRAIIRTDGTIIWSSAVDLKTATLLPAESELLKARLGDPAFFDGAKRKHETTSYIGTSRGVYLISTAQIIRSDESGTPRGLMINGILLDEKALSAALQVQVRINRSPGNQTSRSLLAAPSHSLSTITNAAILTRVGLFDDARQLLTTIDFSTPRTISGAGQSAIYSASCVSVLSVLLVTLILSIGVRRITVRRIQALETYVRNFRVSGHDLHKSMLDGEDEIALLSRQFQSLSEKLTTAEVQLRERSYIQGKADSAAGMLHNVRNALAPLRVMQEKWLREESMPYRSNIQRAIDELAGGRLDPKRKADLEQFLLSAVRKIALTSQERLGEMQETKESIDQISQILAGYDFDTSGKREPESLHFLQMLRQEAKAIAVREGPPIRWELPDKMPLIAGNRVHLAQVLGNICVNAHEAVVAAGVAEMVMRVSCAVNEAEGIAVIRMTDNGDGIAAGDQPRVFQRGYSTREDKSGGIGLHWTANAMRAMNGSITLESDGKGQGATAILTLALAKTARVELALAA